tara:strand:+ start:1624 stop:2148 length:525 start_codon:yes stop_codon:yes gene_type:complete
MSYTQEQIEMIIKENEKLKKENENIREKVIEEFQSDISKIIEKLNERLDIKNIIIEKKDDEIMKLRKEIIEYENVGIFNMMMLKTTYGQIHSNRVKEEYLNDKYDDIDSLVSHVDKHLLDCQKNAFFEYLNFSVYENEKELLENCQVETLEELQDVGYFIINTLWSDELLVLEP